MKKIISVLCALAILLSLTSCFSMSEEYVSGVANLVDEENSIKYERYENRLHGIIIEYPSEYERNGNLEADGLMSFDHGDASIAVYLPDTDANLKLSSKDYSERVLRLRSSEDAGVVTYGKSTGYLTTYKEDGNLTLEFIVKGIDAFYRFSFTCPADKHFEYDPIFTSVMGSIRIDDGVYSTLNKMAVTYEILLQYPISMQYSTDADYASHCLNNYEISGDKKHLDTAIGLFTSIRNELQVLCEHEREENESFEDLWIKISDSAKSMVDACDKAIEAIGNGDLETAKKLSRSAFTYDLSDNSSLFLSAIKAELAEY